MGKITKKLGGLMDKLKSKLSLAPTAAEDDDDSAMTGFTIPAVPRTSARSGRGDLLPMSVQSRRARESTSITTLTTATGSGVSKASQNARPNVNVKSIEVKWARIIASFPTLKKSKPIRTIEKPTAADLWGSNKDDTTTTTSPSSSTSATASTSTSANTSFSSSTTSTTTGTTVNSVPSVTPVPDSTTQAQAGPASQQLAESNRVDLGKYLAKKRAETLTPAQRALALSEPAFRAPAEQSVASSAPKTAPDFAQYRDKPQGDDSDSSDDEDDDSGPLQPSKDEPEVLKDGEIIDHDDSESSESESEDEEELPESDTSQEEVEAGKDEQKPAAKQVLDDDVELEDYVSLPDYSDYEDDDVDIPAASAPQTAQPAVQQAQQVDDDEEDDVDIPVVSAPQWTRRAVQQQQTQVAQVEEQKPAVQQVQDDAYVRLEYGEDDVDIPTSATQIVQPTVQQVQDDAYVRVRDYEIQEDNVDIPTSAPQIVQQPAVQQKQVQDDDIVLGDYENDVDIVPTSAPQIVQPAIEQAAPQIVQPVIQQAVPQIVQPAVQQAQDVEVEFEDCQDEDVVCARDVEMMPAGIPFGAPSGAPSSSAAAPVFGVPVPAGSSPFAQQAAAQQQQQQSAMPTAFGASPFSNPAVPAAAAVTPTTTPAFGATPFGHLSKAVASTTTSAFGAPSGLSLPTTSIQPRQPSPGPIVNPFAPSSKPQQTSPFMNTAAPATAPATAPAPSPFGIFSNALSDSAQIGVTKPNPFEALNNTSTAQQSQQSGAPKPNPFDPLKNQPKQSPAASAPSFGGPKKTVHFAEDVQISTMPAVTMAEGRFAPQPSEGTKKLSSLAVDYAQKVHSRLRSDGITAPKWPSDPGNPAQRPAMEKLKESYKKYRAKAYDSLRKAEIIDHPDHKRRLEDALTFKGICEDMCPDYEQVTRICEYDVKKEEKRPAPNGGDPWPEPSKMVKKFARSAAGIEEPLPMDVRSIDALKRSTDYLLGELLKTDDQLPTLHGYLWDRTRAVRKDFSFHSHKTSEEMQVMVYILETIARFHVVSLHLLSRKGVASDDFDQQQEVTQLGATLLSLNETYDDCRPRNLVCENEGEFRALYLLLNMHNPSIVEKSLEWAEQPWYDSTHMENAKSLLAALQSFDQVTGPFAPRSLGTHFAASGFTKFFDLVGSKTVSYTMACMCEIHFTWLRERILQTLVKGFARRRDWPKDITPRILNRMLRFDTDEEAVDFVKLHGFEFEAKRVDGRQQQFLLLKSKRQQVTSPRVLQSHSATIVEAKRNGQPLAEVFRHSIYGDKDIEFSDGDSERSNVLPDNTADNVDSDDGDDMFVGQSSREKSAQSARDINDKQPQAQQTTISFGAPSGAPFTAKMSPIASNTSSLGARMTPFTSTASPFAAKTSPFAPTSATPSVSQPASGILQNGATTAPASQPAAPSASPFGQSSGQPSTNPFGSLTPATQQPAANNGPATPAAQPAKAPDTSGFSFLGAAKKQTQAPASGAPVSSDVGKTSSPFQGFTTGGSQTGTPTAATPSTVNKAASILDAKTATPQSSVFSSLTPDKSTPSSGVFFPTSTPAASSSGVQPSAASTTPATSILSAAGSVDANKSTSAVPPASVFAQPPATTSSTPAPTPQSQTPQRGSTPTQHVSTPAKQPPPTPAAPSPSPAPPPTKPTDPMADFTKWFVKGDDGLLQDFTEFAVEDMLATTFAQFQAEEADRVRREEDEASWAAARTHMVHRLSVKYFYRWRETARQNSMRRILREGKARYRAAMEAQTKAKREQAAAERKAAERRKRDDEIAAREDKLRNFSAADELVKIAAETHRSRQSSAEEALLASGVFAGVRGDERAVARRVVREAHLPRHRPTSSSRSSIMAPPEITTTPTPPKKEGWKTRTVREKLGLARRGSFSSTSAGGTGTYSNFSRSLPVGEKLPKVTNFSASATSSLLSRKRSAEETSDDEPAAKKGRILKSGFTLHWELRRRGLVQMPDGQWLPERIATQMFEGKRFDGYGDCGLGPGKKVDVKEQTEARDVKGKTGEKDAKKVGKKGEEENLKDKPADISGSTSSAALRQSKLEALAKRFGFPPTKRYYGYGRRADSVASGGSSYNATSLLSSSPAGGGGSKRKRDGDDDAAAGSPNAEKTYVVDSSSEESGGEAAAARTTPAAQVERAMRKMRRQVRELNEDMDVLEAEDRPWMRETTRRLAAVGRKGKGFGELNGGVRDEGGL